MQIILARNKFSSTQEHLYIRKPYQSRQTPWNVRLFALGFAISFRDTTQGPGFNLIVNDEFDETMYFTPENEMEVYGLTVELGDKQDIHKVARTLYRWISPLQEHPADGDLTIKRIIFALDAC